MTVTTAGKARSIVNRSPIYYGWIIWIVATVGIIATMPGQTATVSLFIDRWIVDFGLEGRSTIAALYGAGTFLASLTLTFVGNRIDKHGNRVMSIVIGGLFVLALIFMSMVNSIFMLMVGFMLIRALGQGSMFLVNSTAIANWFQRMRGRVMAFALIGFSLFQKWYIPFMQGLLERNDWRTVWLMLAAAIAILVLPLLALLMREKPEQFGVLPDGENPNDAGLAEKRKLFDANEVNYTLKQAMHLPIFWAFVLGSMMAPTFITGMVFHQESLFTSSGYSAAMGASTIANGILISSISTIITGFLVDKIRPSFVMALQLTALISVMVVSPFLGYAVWVPAIWAVLIGMVMGVGGVFSGAVWANLFGRSHQGEIRGFVSMLTVIGTSIGPFLLAFSYDKYGDYNVSLYMGAAFILIPLVWSLFMTNPRSRTA